MPGRGDIADYDCPAARGLWFEAEHAEADAAIAANVDGRPLRGIGWNRNLAEAPCIGICQGLAGGGSRDNY